MSDWDREHPEQSLEVGQLPPSQQIPAYREAMGYDPDRLRDECRDEGHPILNPKQSGTCACGRRKA